MTSTIRIMRKNFFAKPNLLTEYPLPDHNALLVGDALSTLSINYRWRRMITDALSNYLDSLNAENEDPEYIDMHNQFLALIEDLYS